MNCPYCKTEMKSGRINTKAVMSIIHHPANIIFEPDDYHDKQRVSMASARREGWYCESCKKIIGIFDVGL